MNNKNKAKGFTLIELIIVMAIFGIIMLGVMKIADPLAKVMNKSSTKEKSSAYVDNISDYLDKSMRYAKYMQVYQGEISDYAGLSEKEAVQEFVKDYFDGCITKGGDLMKGKLHVMRLISQSTYGPEGTPTHITVPMDNTGTNVVETKDGEIWETIYDFTCGDSYKDSSDIVHWLPEPNVTLKSSQMVVNPEHLENYGYYYRYGYSTFEAVSHGSNKETFFALKDSPITTGSNRFALSLVAYPEGNMETKPSGEKWFQSPCYMNTMSMYLINTENANTNITDIRQVQDNEGIAHPVEGVIPVESITLNNLTFVNYVPTAATTDNIYFIYVVPSELYLT